MTTLRQTADVDTIMEAILSLSYKEQRDIAKRLVAQHLDVLLRNQGEIDPARERSCADRWQHLRGVMQEVSGEDIAARSRRRSVIVARWCAFMQMRKDGYSYMEMQRASGFDHATIINAQQRVNDALDYPNMYPDFVRAYRMMRAAV